MAVLGGVKRVKSGCITCRIRRVKCDEEKPACRRCISTGRKCDGYSTLPFSRRDLQAAASQSALQSLSGLYSADRGDDLIPRLITDPAFSDLLEKRYFQFFRQKTVACTNSIVDSRFWDRVVLQACHREPAIKHAVLALSSLHQLSDLAIDGEEASRHRLYAEKQHHKALACARSLIAASSPQDVDRILIACVVFIIFESVRGDYKAAAMHMDSGRAIVAQNTQVLKHSSRRRDLVEIEQALARLDLTAVCFTDRSSPYQYNLDDFYRTNPSLSPVMLQDVGEAQASLIDLTRWLIITSNHINTEHKDGDMRSIIRYKAEKSRCAVAIQRWSEQFNSLLERTGDSDSSLVLNLKVWHANAELMIGVEKSGPQAEYDLYMHHFREVVECIEILAKRLFDPNTAKSFSFDLGYTIPLYFTATRCRDPVLRRRAVNLLRTYPRQEGVCQSVMAGAVAATWIEVEEGGLGKIQCAADIPECKRIRFIDTEIHVERKTASVKLAANDVNEKLEVFADWNESGAGEQ